MFLIIADHKELFTRQNAEYYFLITFTIFDKIQHCPSRLFNYPKLRGKGCAKET